ncbi:hypothetical protein GYMLUDRAFT_38497 [Collybiopsis luxurians FD-317 M1]|nr:hypothetical protein GYMLUDRAFT_38497 [Collybiopsis luxurians FD-317 M1]
MEGRLCVFQAYAPLNQLVDENHNTRGLLIVGSPGIGASKFQLYRRIRLLTYREIHLFVV